MTVRTFRRLLILSVVLPIVGALVSVATEHRLPSQLREYVAAQSATLPSTVTLVGCLILLGAWIAAVVGLYRLKPFGRRLFLLTLVVGLTLTPALGPYVDSGWGQLFYQATFVLDGLLVALMYWSPLAEQFSGGREVTRA
jgi:hypothetical protein